MRHNVLIGSFMFIISSFLIGMLSYKYLFSENQALYTIVLILIIIMQLIIIGLFIMEILK